MSTTTTVRTVIYCDHAYADDLPCCLREIVSAAPEREARRSAMREGWSHRRKAIHGGASQVTIDLCPEHSRR